MTELVYHNFAASNELMGLESRQWLSVATDVSKRETTRHNLSPDWNLFAINNLDKRTEPEYDKPLDLTTILQKVQRVEECGMQWTQFRSRETL